MATYAPLLTDSGTRMAMMKASSDPETDGSWASAGGIVRMAAGINPGVTSIWAFEDDSDIHVATMTVGGRIEYHVFDPGTDTWTLLHDFVDMTPNTDETTQKGVSIALRSDGDVIVLHTEDLFAAANEIHYARKESGAWTRSQDVESGASSYSGAVIVPGASDRMHFFYNHETAAEVRHRSLSSANALDTSQAVDVDTSPFVEQSVHHGVTYVSTETKVRCPYATTAGWCSIAELDSGADPTISTSLAGDAATLQDGDYYIMCLAVDGTNLHMIYSADADADIDRDENDDDGGWGTDASVQSGVTCNRISCNVYTRGDRVLAYLWLSGTTATYDEVVLAAAAPALDGWFVQTEQPLTIVPQMIPSGNLPGTIIS